MSELTLPLDALPGQARVRIACGGPDAERFLQGILSCDVAAVTDNEVVPAALLTAKGKIVSDAVLSRRGGFALWVPADAAGEVHQVLEKHVIMDDVVLARDPERCVWVGTGAAPEGAQRCRYPVEGWWLERTRGSGGPESVGDAAAWQAHRVEHGVPAWGYEVHADRFPPEVGFAGAVSYTKGCYMGQEPLARIHARGKVNWVMVRVRAEGPVEPGAGLTGAREDAGRVTTVAADGAGLATVHRSVAVPGTKLTAAGTEVEVCSEPIGDDPGVTAGTPR